MGSPLTKYELETVINFNMGSKEATVYTRDRTVMRKLDRMVFEHPGVYRLVSETFVDKTYAFPKKYLRFGNPPSEAQIAAGRRNMAKILGSRADGSVSGAGHPSGGCSD